jgi:hypothetical protein
MQLSRDFLGIEALRHQPQALLFTLAQGWQGFGHSFVPPAWTLLPVNKLQASQGPAKAYHTRKVAIRFALVAKVT